MNIRKIETEADMTSFIENGVTVVKFSAPWCGPCRVLAENMKNFDESKIEGVLVGEVDVDELEDLSVKYNIRNIPTLIYFKNGEGIDRTVGLVSEDVFCEKVNAVKNANS